jgi:uncharacterized protein YjbJ (UPF0337 family)
LVDELPINSRAAAAAHQTKGASVHMNSDQMAGKWTQIKGKAKQQWGKLTDDDLDVIAGKRDVLVGKLQERYGYAKEDAQKKADEWLKTVDEEPTHAGAPSHMDPGHKR